MYVIGMCIPIVGELLPSPSKKEDLRGVFGAGLVGRESEMDVTEMRCFKGLEEVGRSEGREAVIN